MKQKWEDVVICGDAVKVMDAMPAGSVDLIVTSPSYNLGMKYAGRQDDAMPWAKYWVVTRKWMESAYRVLKIGGRMCVNHYLSCGDAKRGRVAPLMKIETMAEEIGFRHHGVAIWNDATVSRLTAWGSWLSASAPYINSPYEGILLLYKYHWKKMYRGESTIEKDQFIQGVSGVWRLRSEKNRKDHPSPFTLDLPMMCINLLSYKGDLVLDPFAGTGTTCVAAALTGRHYIGIDIAQKYVLMSRKRIGRAISHGEDRRRKPRKRTGKAHTVVSGGQRNKRQGRGVPRKHSAPSTGGRAKVHPQRSAGKVARRHRAEDRRRS